VPIGPVFLYNHTVFAHSLSIPKGGVPEEWEGFWGALPARPAVFALSATGEGREPYITKTANLRRRLKRLLSPAPGASKRLALLGRVDSVAYTETQSDLEMALLLYSATRQAFGDRARKRLHLRPPALLRLTWENAYPRAYVTNRTTLRGMEHTYGPFPTRVAAERFLEESLDLFLLRRCTDDLHPDPAFPGCVYSEMKKCLAPCFRGCSDERYAAEATAVRDYFATRGSSLFTVLQQERDDASAMLDFERAAQLHAQALKVKSAAQQAAPLVRPLAQMDAVVLQPARRCTEDTAGSQEGRVADFLLSHGTFFGPEFCLAPLVPAPGEGPEGPLPKDEGMEQPLRQPSDMAQSKAMRALLEARLHSVLEKLQAQAAATRPQMDRILDHLSILSRWYYRRPATRNGEIFFRDNKGDFPWQRTVRSMERMARGEGPPDAATGPDTVSVGESKAASSVGA
jgi:hypothetical protein